jgi:rRNA maturation protein Rpf1
MNLNGIAEKALEIEADRVIVVSRWKGGLGKFEFFKAGSEGLAPVFPILCAAGIQLQREFNVRIGPVRSLAATVSSECSPEVMKTAESLADFFNLPFLQKETVPLKYRASMHFSSDALCRAQITFMLLPKFIEVGPRIIISHAVWDDRE